MCCVKRNFHPQKILAINFYILFVYENYLLLSCFIFVDYLLPFVIGCFVDCLVLLVSLLLTSSVYIYSRLFITIIILYCSFIFFYCLFIACYCTFLVCSLFALCLLTDYFCSLFVYYLLLSTWLFDFIHFFTINFVKFCCCLFILCLVLVIAFSCLFIVFSKLNICALHSFVHCLFILYILFVLSLLFVYCYYFLFIIFLFPIMSSFPVILLSLRSTYFYCSFHFRSFLLAINLLFVHFWFILFIVCCCIMIVCCVLVYYYLNTLFSSL